MSMTKSSNRSRSQRRRKRSVNNQSESIVSRINNKMSEIQRDNDKITLKKVVLCIVSAIVTALLPILFTVEYNLLFCHPTELQSISVKLMGDANTIEPGQVASKTFYYNGNGEITLGHNSDDTWNCYAPKIKIDFKYKGTLKAIYVFYKDDIYDGFIMQKASGAKTRILNCFSSNYSSDVVINYSLLGGTEPERVYIMVVDTDNNPSIFCALINRYEPLELSSETELDVRSSEEIYELSPNRSIDYWATNQIEIIGEISDLLKQKGGIVYSSFG